ncbi:hypothetical protein PV10_08407 [Exophiala mesophila]|uniref:Uncharacterized protein n=1 Tax=Exophiala mesophila TaxID=212818 RepID=A0A0D1Z1W8_EXOME|nr:uncharacterized protein PV10_08407 [Exophiala mesophila]KIV88762.1 hypothetical protein PV10_08407 [Exophiala mesophila]
MPSQKTFITSSHLPHSIPVSPCQTHTNSRVPPWRIINDISFNQSVTISFPNPLYEIIWPEIQDLLPDPKYAKVVLKLEDLLVGDGFDIWIKRGNVLMLSEGKAGVDSLFSLYDGILRLELSKDDYERAGLQGKPVMSGARKHIKARFAVELNLRLPSMLHGKKGFDRIFWAAKNVLNQSLTWLVVDLAAGSDGMSDNDIHASLNKHHPTIRPITPTSSLLPDVLVPSSITQPLDLSPPPTSAKSTLPSEETQESLYDLFEYIDMLSLRSPRILKDHRVDPFISRYVVPDEIEHAHPDPHAHVRPVRVMTWTGLISARWILQLFCHIIKQSRSSKVEHLSHQDLWLAMTVTAHKTRAVGQNDGYTVLLQGDQTANLKLLGVEENDRTTIEDPTEDKEDVVMGEGDADEVESQQQQQAPQSSQVKPKIGFHRYLAAEYIDT